MIKFIERHQNMAMLAVFLLLLCAEVIVDLAYGFL